MVMIKFCYHRNMCLVKESLTLLQRYSLHIELDKYTPIIIKVDIFYIGKSKTEDESKELRVHLAFKYSATEAVTNERIHSEETSNI